MARGGVLLKTVIAYRIDFADENQDVCALYA
jgi:hypothetical protein